MNTAFLIKSLGYLVSVVSVMLLGAVTWEAASGSPWMRIALLGGMATSFMGMGLRWLSYYLAHRRELALKRSDGKS